MKLIFVKKENKGKNVNKMTNVTYLPYTTLDYNTSSIL